MVEEERCDVALMQETKLQVEDGEVRVHGFEMLRCDRWEEGGAIFPEVGLW